MWRAVATGMVTVTVGGHLHASTFKVLFHSRVLPLRRSYRRHMLRSATFGVRLVCSSTAQWVGGCPSRRPLLQVGVPSQRALQLGRHLALCDAGSEGRAASCSTKPDAPYRPLASHRPPASRSPRAPQPAPPPPPPPPSPPLPPLRRLRRGGGRLGLAWPSAAAHLPSSSSSAPYPLPSRCFTHASV